MFDTIFNTQTREEWFNEWLMKQNFDKDLMIIKAELEGRRKKPDWNRPIVMYGVRKTTHKYVRKEEIAIIIDGIPWQNRARMAESHWYRVIFKRPATDEEWTDFKRYNATRRYTIWSHFISKKQSIDRIISTILREQAGKQYIEQETADKILSAFEQFYKMKINISFSS